MTSHSRKFVYNCVCFLTPLSHYLAVLNTFACVSRYRTLTRDASLTVRDPDFIFFQLFVQINGKKMKHPMIYTLCVCVFTLKKVVVYIICSQIISTEVI